jgi:hypothetical protein
VASCSASSLVFGNLETRSVGHPTIVEIVGSE